MKLISNNDIINWYSINNPIMQRILYMNTTQLKPSGTASTYRRSVQNRQSAKRSRILSYVSLFFLPIFLIVCEFMLKISIFGKIGGKQFFYLTAFSLSAGLLITLFCRLFACGIAKLSENKNVIRPLTAVLIGIVSVFFTVLYLVQFVYFGYFGDFFKWSTIDMAGDVTQFYREIIATILKGWYWVLLFLVPIVLYIIFPAKRMPTSYMKPASAFIVACIALICHFGAEAVIMSDDEDYGDKTYYTEIFDAAYSMQNFGLLAETTLDFKEWLFGGIGFSNTDDDIIIPPTDLIPDVIVTPGTDSSTDTEEEEEFPNMPEVLGYNVTDIDFESLINKESDKTIRNMHTYFSSLEGSKQHKYTGYFKGKNIIFITLEGFSSKVIDPELTPTLYKMSTEGFIFNNYYTPHWGGSTATGEYAVITGNFYKSAKCIEMSSKTLQPFALGNVFSDLGYKTTAYHNNSYTYYKRNLSHPNFGYTWKAIGNGLELKSNVWPRSDFEMAQVTGPEYVSSTPFLTYYMTISGHANYTWSGNTMATWHRLKVQHLPYSENVKAYIACQYEVELMLTNLMDQLREAGTLDDTVFVITEDHYPYALEQSELAELYGFENDKSLYSNFDLYKNFFCIYSTSMKKPVVVNEPCSQIDVLPTVLNLWGIEYDSRLITGTDILSDTPNVVILSCTSPGPSWNWITRYGSYNTNTEKMTVAPGVEFASEEAKNQYIKSMKDLVSLKRKYSYLILEEDYYSYVFK